MHRYTVAFRYSKNGQSWTTTSTTVRAESERDAIAIVESKYPYVEIKRVDRRD